jgi:phytoene dehydrogenase-like protein
LQTAARNVAANPAEDFDAVIIGAGVSGLYQLHRLRQLGLKVRVFESGTGVGGTWYWNRYRGARFDSESYTYGYSFSPELLEEWDWEGRFASQPETERYLNYVADKFDLRRDIQCNSRVTAAHYQEEARSWDVALEDGGHYGARFLITAIGVLSAPTMPRIAGVPGALRRDPRLLHLRPRPPRHFRGDAGGTRGLLGKTLRRSASGRATSATSWSTAMPMRWSPTSSRARSASGSRTRQWPKS